MTWLRLAIGCEVLGGVIMLTEWGWRMLHNDGHGGGE